MLSQRVGSLRLPSPGGLSLELLLVAAGLSVVGGGEAAPPGVVQATSAPAHPGEEKSNYVLFLSVSLEMFYNHESISLLSIRNM